MNDVVKENEPRKWLIDNPETMLKFDKLTEAKARAELLEAEIQLLSLQAWNAVYLEHPDVRDVKCAVNRETGEITERVYKNGRTRLTEMLTKMGMPEEMVTDVIESVDAQVEGGCADPECEDCGDHDVPSSELN
jgi:hypothetical protein